MNLVRFARLSAPVTIVALAVAVAGCAGGSTVAHNPVSTPSASAGSGVTSTITIPAGGGSVALATVGGQTATFDFSGSGIAGTTITATSSTTAPGNAPAPSAVLRRPQALAGAVPVFFVTFTVSPSLTAASIASESVTLGANDPTIATYFAEYDDITAAPGTKIFTFGPGTVANGTATIANGATGLTSPVTFEAGHTYLLQFYYLPVGTASPSPGSSPSASASSAPSPTPSAGSSSAPSPAPSASALPAFTMSGGNDECLTTTAGSCGPTASGSTLAFTDGAVTFEAGFASPTSTSTSPLSLYLQGATSTAQISPSASFPVYNNVAGGTVQVYFTLNTANGSNVPTGSATYANTPQLVVSGVSGSGCIFYGYNTTGSTSGWGPVVPATGSETVSGGSVTFPPSTVGGSGITVNATQFLGAIVCQ